MVAALLVQARHKLKTTSALAVAEEGFHIFGTITAHDKTNTPEFPKGNGFDRRVGGFGHIMAGARGGEVDGNGSVIVGVCGGVREGAGLKPHMRIGRWLCL